MKIKIVESLNHFKRKELLIFSFFFIILLIFGYSVNYIKYNTHFFFFIFYLIFSFMMIFWSLFVFKVWFKQDNFSYKDLADYYKQEMCLTKEKHISSVIRIWFRVNLFMKIFMISLFSLIIPFAFIGSIKQLFLWIL